MAISSSRSIYRKRITTLPPQRSGLETCRVVQRVRSASYLGNRICLGGGGFAGRTRCTGGIQTAKTRKYCPVDHAVPPVKANGDVLCHVNRWGGKVAKGKASGISCRYADDIAGWGVQLSWKERGRGCWRNSTSECLPRSTRNLGRGESTRPWCYQAYAISIIRYQNIRHEQMASYIIFWSSDTCVRRDKKSEI
jgi:hypothetical protein